MEITSFVHPKRVPNMADAEEVFLNTKELADFGVLIPNQRGFERAKALGAKKFNVFFSPSNEFNYRNLGKTLEETYISLEKMLVEEDRKNIRAYVSCAFGCPFEGLPSDYSLKDCIEKASNLAEDVVLCDTIGAAYPSKVTRTLELTKRIDSKISLHLHEKKTGSNDIFSNVKSALDWGITSFDSSINGLGGCPFMPDSGSNLSTNQLINWANDNGYDTGIDLKELTYATELVRSLERGSQKFPEGFITETTSVAE